MHVAHVCGIQVTIATPAETRIGWRVSPRSCVSPRMTDEKIEANEDAVSALRVPSGFTTLTRCTTTRRSIPRQHTTSAGMPWDRG
jgi:hypothetical protein